MRLIIMMLAAAAAAAPADARVRRQVAAVVAAQPEAVELGRRLAAAALEPEISARIDTLMAELEAEARAAAPDSRILASSPLDPGHGAARTAARALLLERLGLLYARQHSVEDLRQMVAFFEGGAGRKFAAGGAGSTKQIDALVQWPNFRADLRRATCEAQRHAWREIFDVPHAYLRLSDGRIVRHAGAPKPPHAAPPLCRGLDLGEPLPADAAGLGRRLAAAGTFDPVYRIAAAEEVERIVEGARGLSAPERQRLREIGTEQRASAHQRLIAQVGALYARHYSPDQLRAIVGFFEGPAGTVYRKAFGSLVPDMAWAALRTGFGAKLPPSLARLAARAPENWSDIRVPEFRKGAMEASKRLAEVSDFTAMILALDPAMRGGAAGKDVIPAIGGRFFDAYEWATVPIPALLPGDRTEDAALEQFIAFFESGAGRAYTAALPALLPELAALVRAENVAAATRAEFCQETRKLCGG